MKLPNQTRAVERKTYNANAVTVGANASFLGALVPILAKAAKGAIGAFS
ncbi:MAG: hypothetical protein AAF617_04965 [Bacteroidota bacterium]